MIFSLKSGHNTANLTCSGGGSGERGVVRINRNNIIVCHINFQERE